MYVSISSRREFVQIQNVKIALHFGYCCRDFFSEPYTIFSASRCLRIKKYLQPKSLHTAMGTGPMLFYMYKFAQLFVFGDETLLNFQTDVKKIFHDSHNTEGKAFPLRVLWEKSRLCSTCYSVKLSIFDSLFTRSRLCIGFVRCPSQCSLQSLRSSSLDTRKISQQTFIYC